VHKLLKLKNLDVNEADRATGNVALHYAAAKGHLDIVRTLLTDPRTDPNRENLHNTTPLILAAGNGQMEVVEELLDCKRTDPNYEARGPLHVSTHRCRSPARVPSQLLLACTCSTPPRKRRAAHQCHTSVESVLVGQLKGPHAIRRCVSAACRLSAL
jgi:hypothetical protein